MWRLARTWKSTKLEDFSDSEEQNKEVYEDEEEGEVERDHSHSELWDT